MELSSFELQTGPPRRTLIAVDLGEFSERIVSHIFLVARDILSEFTIFHCLEDAVAENEAQDKIDQILQRAQSYLNKDAGSKIKIHIAKNDLIEEIQLLHAKENFGTVVIGTTNNPDSWQMGHIARAVLISVDANILTIPPGVSMTFPGNVSILVEKVQKSSFAFLNTFHEFVSHYGIFLNFVLFAKDKQALDEERKLIEEYQDFFDSAITFSFIVEQEQNYLYFLKYIEEIHSESAVLTWQKGNTAYQSANQHGVVYCSPRLPILYMKRGEPDRRND